MPKLKNRSPRMYRDRQWAFVKLDGQRIPLGRWESVEAQEAYNRVVGEWLQNGRNLPEPNADDDPEETVVVEVCVKYLKHVQERYHPSKQKHVELAFKLLRSLYGSEPVNTFGPKRLRIIRQQMIESGLARSTINERVGWTVRAFKWAASHEICSDRIYRRLTTVTGIKRGETEGRKVKPVPRF